MPDHRAPNLQEIQEIQTKPFPELTKCGPAEVRGCSLVLIATSEDPASVNVPSRHGSGRRSCR